MTKSGIRMMGASLLVSVAIACQTVSVRSSDTPWLPSHRDGNPDGVWMKTHDRQLLEKEAMSRVDWVMIGDSLTAGWQTDGKDVQERCFRGRNILNLGMDGDLTEEVLWRIGSGAVFNISPKLITVMVGRENITSEFGVSVWKGRFDAQALKGIEAVVEQLRERCPDAAVVLLSNLPEDATPGSPLFERISKANALIKASAKFRRYAEADALDLGIINQRMVWMNHQLAAWCKGKTNVTYLDIHDQFLDADGHLLKSALKPDLKHLNAEGYELWAKAMAPTVEKIMGPVPSKHRGNTPEPRNNATYQKQLAEKKGTTRIDLVFVGDSITQGWTSELKPGVPGGNRAGKAVWDEYYGKRHAINYGMGGDRTWQTLWRLQHGLLDGISPKLVVLMEGVNNIGRKECTPLETVAGLEAILDEIHQRCPQAHILHLATFPWGEQPYDPGRRRVDQINSYLPALAAKKAREWGDDRVLFMHINDRFLNPDGTAKAELLPDFCHPSDKGYQAWAQAIEPVVEKYCDKLN